MALVIGTVEIDDNEDETTSGLAGEIYALIKSTESDAGGLPSLTPSDSWTRTAAAWEAEIKPARLKILRSWARRAEAIAGGIVPYLQANPDPQQWGP